MKDRHYQPPKICVEQIYLESSISAGSLEPREIEVMGTPEVTDFAQGEEITTQGFYQDLF